MSLLFLSFRFSATLHQESTFVHYERLVNVLHFVPLGEVQMCPFYFYPSASAQLCTKKAPLYIMKDSGKCTAFRTVRRGANVSLLFLFVT